MPKSRAAKPAPSNSTSSYRIGIDENGLGAQLGPMLVTATLAEVNESGQRFLSRKLPKTLAADLDDSKALVSCHDVSLGEAWTRALLQRTLGKSLKSPAAVFRAVTLTPERRLRQRCPDNVEAQCWTSRGEKFTASAEQLSRVSRHLEELDKRGVSLRAVRSESICTAWLNALKREGIHRFTADLHAMERLTLALREEAGVPIVAVCGKVGGIGQYGKFFGPLSDRLHTVLQEERACSAYHFPDLGEMRFVRDADASDPLVMLSSLVGKYLRELMMGRVARFYPDALGQSTPSGYHDPVSMRFVDASEAARKRLKIVDDCFFRIREPKRSSRAAKPKTATTKDLSAQKKLF